MRHGKLLVAAAVVLLLAGAPPFASLRQAGRLGAGRPDVGCSAQRHPAHTDAYQVWVSPLDVGAVLRQLEHDPSLLHPPGAWTPSALLPSEAFGQTGGCERVSRSWRGPRQPWRPPWPGDREERADAQLRRGR